MGRDMKITFPGGKRVDAYYKGFHIETDQPVYQGGEGSAPAPFDLFLVSIGTCSGIYVLSFCQNRNIPTEDLTLTMRSERNSETKRIERIIIDIQLPAGFPEKYTNAVIKSVNGCAVKIHMEHEPVFEVRAHIP
ncbi:MAG: OsmC family protein [Candidatus Aminicenantes bacterium]|jgi:ribosomal protein S12 methylthiotransferase accessory factor